jgi:hypothetical protein
MLSDIKLYHYFSPNFIVVMIKQLLLSVAIGLATIAQLSAQKPGSHAADTFRIQNFPLKYWYNDKPIKKPNEIQTILFRKNDAQIERDWRNAKTLRTAGTVVQVAGLIVEGIGLINIAQGKGDDNNLLLKGIGISLGGVIIQAIGTGPAKKSMRRFNSLRTGRTATVVAPPIPTVFAPVSDSSALSLQNNATSVRPNERQLPKAAVSSRFWLAIGTGAGWSKQNINYEAAYESPLKHARSFHYSLQFGQKITERMGWQAELGISQHGYREESSIKTQGVTTEAKADLRAKFTELPVLISYNIPTGFNPLSIDLLGGLCAGRLKSAKLVVKASGENNDTKVYLRVSTPLDLRNVESNDKWDTALQFGARIGYAIGFGRLCAEARYHYGFLNLERNSELTYEAEKAKRFNRTLSIRLGYQVPIAAQ